MARKVISFNFIMNQIFSRYFVSYLRWSGRNRAEVICIFVICPVVSMMLMVLNWTDYLHQRFKVKKYPSERYSDSIVFEAWTWFCNCSRPSNVHGRPKFLKVLDRLWAFLGLKRVTNTRKRSRSFRVYSNLATFRAINRWYNLDE